MHTFGLLACSANLMQMDEVLLSATVLFCSPCTGDNVAKHYNNLQELMQQVGKLEVEEQNYKVIYSVTSIYVDHWHTQPCSKDIAFQDIVSNYALVLNSIMASYLIF